jgi:hypothetical protein
VDSLRHIPTQDQNHSGPPTARPADEPRSPRWRSIATPRTRLPKRPTPDNPDPSLLIRRLYDALVELEALAITADEAVTMLPAGPTGRHKRILTRLYTLVGRTAGQASAVLELGEELVDLHEAARGAKP